MQGVGRVVGYLQYTAAICLLMFVCTCSCKPMVRVGGLVGINMRYWWPYILVCGETLSLLKMEIIYKSLFILYRSRQHTH